MNKDALVRVVAATRLSIEFANNIDMAITYGKTQTKADDIAGILSDALFFFSGETLEHSQDFTRDSMTMKLLRSELSNEEVANAIIAMTEQPRPHTFESSKMEELYRNNGGYMHTTPEGEWNNGGAKQ